MQWFINIDQIRIIVETYLRQENLPINFQTGLIGGSGFYDIGNRQIIGVQHIDDYIEIWLAATS